MRRDVHTGDGAVPRRLPSPVLTARPFSCLAPDAGGPAARGFAVNRKRQPPDSRPAAARLHIPDAEQSTCGGWGCEMTVW